MNNNKDTWINESGRRITYTWYGTSCQEWESLGYVLIVRRKRPGRWEAVTEGGMVQFSDKTRYGVSRQIEAFFTT